jgi:hypothetical protein
VPVIGFRCKPVGSSVRKTRLDIFREVTRWASALKTMIPCLQEKPLNVEASRPYREPTQLSAVAPSTSTRHPRKARPINWAQRGGLASGRKYSPDAEATFHRASCTPGNHVVRASDGPPFRQERRPTRVGRTPRAGSGLLAEASTLRAGDRVPGWRPHR